MILTKARTLSDGRNASFHQIVETIVDGPGLPIKVMVGAWTTEAAVYADKPLEIYEYTLPGLTTWDEHSADLLPALLEATPAWGADTTPYTPEQLVLKASPPGVYWIWNELTRSWDDNRTIEQARTLAWERIKQARDAAEVAGFIHDGHAFDSDSKSVQKISGSVQMALLAQMAGQPFLTDWTLADNTVLPLDGPAMIAVGLSLGTTIAAIFDTGRALRTAIQEAETIADIDAIAWPSGSAL